jgi:hypothetical protein
VIYTLPPCTLPGYTLPLFSLSTVDGESRASRVWPDGSYSCGFCGSPVPSQAAWDANEANTAEHYARQGEMYEPRPYPVYLGREYAARRCANPACLVNLNAEQLAGTRRRIAEHQAEIERRARLEEAWRCEQAARAARNDQLWDELSTLAAIGGRCQRCLSASDWKYGRPKLVRHRDIANCPVARKYAK